MSFRYGCQLLFLLGMVFITVTCADEGPIDNNPNVVYDVDPAFEEYVQEFIAEGAKRGKTISFDDSGLRIQFTEFPLDGAAGFCRLGRYDVEIDKANWFRFSERFRSYLLFHELGHCELDRLHRNDKFSDDTWKSILRGDPFKGIENRQPVAYFGFRKEYYIDELFDDTTPDPAWSRRTFNIDTEYNRTNVESQEDVGRINERYNDRSSNYEVELEFNLVIVDNTRTKLEWGVTGANYFIEIIPGWGFYIGVSAEGLDNYLFYSSNVNLVNGEVIGKVTLRNIDGIEQVFINDQFIFHIDAQANLDYVRMTAMQDDQLSEDFVVSRYSISDID